jgi:hypothetical protein
MYCKLRAAEGCDTTVFTVQLRREGTAGKEKEQLERGRNNYGGDAAAGKRGKSWKGE